MEFYKRPYFPTYLRRRPDIQITAQEYLEKVGEVFAAITNYIDENISVDLKVTISLNNGSYDLDISTMSECCKIRVLQLQPEISLIGIPEVCKTINFHTTTDLSHPSFNIWLKKACLIIDQVEKQVLKMLPNLASKTQTKKKRQYKTSTVVDLEGMVDVENAKNKIGTRIDFQHLVDLVDHLKDNL